MLEQNAVHLASPDTYIKYAIQTSVRRGFGAFAGERPREWPEILHADVSWPSSELISLWSQSVDFSNFGTILT